jgi:type 1 glutamine amidotransferase
MMLSRRQFNRFSLALALPGLARVHPRGAPLRVLVLDGINNHDWRTATAGISRILSRTGLFAVEVSTSPPREALPKEWDFWKPEFSRYDVIVNNFNGGESDQGIQWPDRVKEALETYLQGGGGLVALHAANNAFLPWAAYNQMIGLGWRKNTYGRGIRISDRGQVVFIPQGTGLDPGHPDRMDFQIHVRDTHHPITRNMPKTWMHPSEQLTHGQHGPAEGLTILTYAHSPVSQANEPMDWVRRYGQGRVYTTMLGHTWVGEPNPNLDCVGFQTLFARGVEWAATGGVTIPIPSDFPGPSNISLHPLDLR